MHIRLVRLFAASLALALLAAAPASARSHKGQPSRLQVGHQNVTVAPVLDPTRAASATIGSAGGSLTATTAGGAALTLTFPAGALAGNEFVTMTPLQRLGHAGVKLVAGAQLTPSGLRLLKPAQLSITPFNPIPRSREVAFGYEKSGTQFGLIPLSLSSAVKIPLVSLGGAGLARGNSGQVSSRAAHLPSDPTAAWLAQLALPLHAQRSKHSVAADVAQVKDLLGAYFQSFVKPKLHSAGKGINAWNREATRALAWWRETRALGYAHSFRSQVKQLRKTVFGKALRHRWQLTTGACASGQRTLGRLHTALVLARTAQTVGTGSKLGGAGAIATALSNCAGLAMTAVLNPTTTGWQSGLASSYLSQINTIVQTPTLPLTLQQELGSDQFAYASARTVPVERVTSWTLAPNYMSQGCTQPTFLGFSSDPNQMYAAFTATLTVPADIFQNAPSPDPTVMVTVSGADQANWSTSCSAGHTTFFSQAPAAMAGLGSVTATTPVRVTQSRTASNQKFVGSANILSGSTITGYAFDNGRITVTAPR